MKIVAAKAMQAVQTLARRTLTSSASGAAAAAASSASASSASASSASIAAAAAAAEVAPTSSAVRLQVSSPHPQSNIRLLRLVDSHSHSDSDSLSGSDSDSDSHLESDSMHRSLSQTPQDVAWLRLRIAAQQRHHEFWTANNCDFQAKKAAFEAQVALEHQSPATPEQLSVFYKEYLNNSYARHAEYNRELWRLNAAMLIPGIQAELRDSFTRLWHGHQAAFIIARMVLLCGEKAEAKGQTWNNG
eukprot:jgi/Hompol1/3451/HPOL_001583-RA